MQGGYPDGMNQREHDEAYKDCPEDEIKTVPLDKLMKKYSMDKMFIRMEGNQEAGKFGITPKRRDD